MREATSEKYYFIMDYNSNYYRIDSKDQLVVAGNEDEAAIFSFADANRRIGSGVKSKFYFMSPANVGSDGDVEEEEEEMISELEETVPDTGISTVRELKEAEISKAAAGPKDEYDLSAINWEDYLTNFDYIATNINGYKDELNQKLGEVDKKICDILHYIELCDTDEADAQDLVELLRVCRENRREYKDELFRADSFQKNVGTSLNIAKAKEALKSIRKLEKRKYTAREFSELFEDGGVVSGKSRRAKHQNTEEKQSNTDQDKSGYQMEDRQMEYEKIATPFDGKENDWLGFARKQAEFYENANQYIINLELELNEIDNDIAALMDEIELANCNVTQGYKVFKQLKELRQARTGKENELRVLYQLTDSFDMGAMADESRRIAEGVEEMINGPQEESVEDHTEETEPDTTENLIDIAG